MNDDSQCAQMVETPPLWFRLGRKLFPMRYPEFVRPQPKQGGWIRTTIIVHFSLADRLRMLFSSRIRVECETATELECGNASTESAVSVLAPWWKHQP